LNENDTTIDLDTLGLEELSSDELVATNGGASRPAECENIVWGT
jgi:hypothetical protein